MNRGAVTVERDQMEQQRQAMAEEQQRRLDAARAQVEHLAASPGGLVALREFCQGR